MKKSELKKAFKLYKNNFPVYFKALTGLHLPDIRGCENYVSSTGNALHMPLLGKCAIKPGKHPTYDAALQNVHDIIQHHLVVQRRELLSNIFENPIETQEIDRLAFNKQLMEVYGDELMQAYVTLLQEEMKLGRVRIPVTYKRLDPEAKVKSMVNGTTINYSPIITEVDRISYMQEIAAMLTKAAIYEKPFSMWTVCCKEPVDEKNLWLIAYKTGEFSIACNRYFTDEYEEKKNREDYRHRDDD